MASLEMKFTLKVYTKEVDASGEACPVCGDAMFLSPCIAVIIKGTIDSGVLAEKTVCNSCAPLVLENLK